MSEHSRSIAFHIGAHKTATSHLQRSLQRAANDLAAIGVRYVGPDILRHPGQGVRAQVLTARDASDRLLISEENFIGALNQPQGRGLTRRYQDAGARLTDLAQSAGGVIDVFLAVRRSTDFLNAAYCQMLLGGRVQPVPLFQKRNPLASVDWPDLVARLRASAGVGRITVWRYEDYGPLFPTIMVHMLGPAAAQLITPRPRHINRSLSQPAVVHLLRGDSPPSDAHRIRRHLPVEDGHAPFDGYATEEHQIADATYARQIARIAAMDGVTLLRV